MKLKHGRLCMQTELVPAWYSLRKQVISGCVILVCCVTKSCVVIMVTLGENMVTSGRELVL